jgi:hypothetical protein
LFLGSPHKKYDSISPKLRRIRTGRYGTGRLSFLTSFQNMKIRTKRDTFHKSLLLEASVLDRLSSGNTPLNEIDEHPLRRNGTELYLKGSKLLIDPTKLSKELRKLVILRQPLFQVFIKTADTFAEWDFRGAEAVKAPDIQGHKLGISLDGGKISGELVIAKRPLSEDETGIAIMVGSHVVTRSSFGFGNKLKRVTGFVRCDSLTSRFADKSALIEDEEYSKFLQNMQTFISNTLIPSLSEYEDVLITREESRIYKEIDKVLGQAIVENIETEEVEGYETVEVRQQEAGGRAQTSNSLKRSQKSLTPTVTSSEEAPLTPNYIGATAEPGSLVEEDRTQIISEISDERVSTQKLPESYQDLVARDNFAGMTQPSPTDFDTTGNAQRPLVITTKIRRPVLKKTFALKKVGYKVIPYEDDSDSRYSFTNENVVFVNKANSTYTAEAMRGDEFLLRHIIGIVAEAIAESRHPEGKDALELQNRLVAEAIRIHDNTVIKK